MSALEVVGYARTSVEDGDSIDAQREAIAKWADEHGHRLLDIYCDDGESGAVGADERPGLAAALAALEEPGERGLLVVHRLDRLGRALHVQEAALAVAWGQGARVYSAVEGEVLQDDPDDPMRKAMRQMAGVFAELERNLIRARMRGGRRRARAEGRHLGGDRPYGFGVVDEVEDGRPVRRLVPVPEEQRIIGRITHWRGRRDRRGRLTWPYARIADRLNSEGVPGPGGKAWYPMAVYRVHRRTMGAKAKETRRAGAA